MNYKILSHAALAMTFIFASPLAYGSTIQSVADCFQSGGAADDLRSTNTPGQLVVSSLDHCTASAYGDWSALKVGGSAGLLTATEYQDAKSTAIWTIYFSLSDPSLPRNYVESVVIPIRYDATLGAVAESGVAESYASFQVSVNNDPYTIPVNLVTAYDYYSNNHCPDPDPINLPRCNGHYVGTAGFTINVTINEDPGFYNRLIITAVSEAVDANVDATHSVSFGEFDLSPTTTFAYDDPTIGNPLNFTSTSNAPEPTSVLLAFAGLCGISARTWFGRR